MWLTSPSNELKKLRPQLERTGNQKESFSEGSWENTTPSTLLEQRTKLKAFIPTGIPKNKTSLSTQLPRLVSNDFFSEYSLHKIGYRSTLTRFSYLLLSFRKYFNSVKRCDEKKNFRNLLLRDMILLVTDLDQWRAFTLPHSHKIYRKL